MMANLHQGFALAHETAPQSRIIPYPVRTLQLIRCTVRGAALMFLLLFYLAFFTGILVGQFIMPDFISGTLTFNAPANDESEGAVPVWRIRRHVPPFRHTPAAVPQVRRTSIENNHDNRLLAVSQFASHSSFFNSGFSDKRPSLSEFPRVGNVLKTDMNEGWRKRGS